MIEFFSALAGAIVFIINQDCYTKRKSIFAFLASFFMGVTGSEFTTSFLTNYIGGEKTFSAEASAFLTSAFIIPIISFLYKKLRSGKAGDK